MDRRPRIDRLNERAGQGTPTARPLGAATRHRVVGHGTAWNFYPSVAPRNHVTDITNPGGDVGEDSEIGQGGWCGFRSALRWSRGKRCTHHGDITWGNQEWDRCGLHVGERAPFDIDVCEGLVPPCEHIDMRMWVMRGENLASHRGSASVMGAVRVLMIRLLPFRVR